MYKKSIKVTTPTGSQLEFSYPKRVSLNEMNYDYISDLSGKFFKEVFKDIKHAILEDAFGKKVKVIDDDCNSILNLTYLRLIDTKGNKLKILPKVIRTKKNNVETYAFKVFLKGINPITQRYDKVVSEITLNLSKEDNKVINEVFSETTIMIKNLKNTIGSLDVSFFIPALNSDDKTSKDEIYSTTCVYPSILNIDDVTWKKSSNVDKNYLCDIINVYLEKAYGFNDINLNGLDVVVKKSKYNFDLNKVIDTINKTKNSFKSFKLNSILIEKSAI